MGARQWKEWTINEAKRFTNDEKWSEYTSRWRKMTWKDVRMTDGRANRRIKRGRTDLQVSTIIYDWSAITLKSAVLCRERDHAHACHLAEKARNKDGCARCWQKAKIYAKLTQPWRAMELWREKQKVMTLYETIKGRTGVPNAHIPMWMQWYYEGKNRGS